jgi:hypothetical protein
LPPKACWEAYKCKVAKPNYNVWQYYMSIESHHAKNEQLFCNGGKDTMVDMVVVGMWLGREKKKFIQFVAIF